MATVLTGLVGGAIATFAMTVLMTSLGDDSPPPTASLWAKYVGRGDPEDYKPQGMALHLGMDPDPKQAGTFLLFHVVYGAVLGAWVWTSPVTPVM